MIPHIPTKAFILSPEQSFEIAKMKTFVSQLKREELERMIIDSMSQNMFMKNVIKCIAKGEIENV